jgi:DNA-binding transcriptional ArsR family regulator
MQHRKSPEAAAFDALCLALSHRARREIVRLLSLFGKLDGPRLASLFPAASRLAIDEHLRCLRAAGLVIVERHPFDRRKLCYALAPQCLRALRDWLAVVNDDVLA